MQCTLKQAGQFIPMLMKHNITPFLHGSPSTGKSSIVKQIADKFNLELIDVRLSQIEPQDLLGLPNFDKDKVTYIPMDTFPIQSDKVPSNKKGWLLFLDEANGASHSVQMASYKLILDREVGNHKLHDKCFIIAAGNLDTDNAITNTMSSALISRMAHFYVELTADDWIEWASENGIDSRIVSYIGFKNSHLSQFNPDNTEPYASPRTWEMLSKVIKDTEVNHDIQPLLYSLIGNVQTEFIAFCQLFNDDDDDFLEALADELALLADASLVNKSYGLTQEAVRTLVQYKLDCEKLSTTYSDMEVIKKSELEHRYFKVLKLAGAYAFIDGAKEITPQYIEYAIALAQDSGKAFENLMTPQRSYVKLAKYLAEYKGEVTLADLDEDLPSFRGSKAQKDEMIMMATAWGYKNNIVIKKSYMESIMFLYADSIEETNLNEMIISYTNNVDMTTGYRNELVSFTKLDKLFTANGYHWLNHHVKDNYRKEDNAITGFNLLVLDVDGTCSLASAKLLMKKYKAIYYTTKSSTDKNNRFRIILPMNYTLKLDAKDYKEFYKNIIKDLPFEVDEQCSHRTKKWLSHGELDDDEVTNLTKTDGELFDVLPYIPKSAKNDEREKLYTEQSDLDNLERWVMNNIGDGNRNNMLLRYALILLDNNFRFETIKEKTIALNNKLADKLSEIELANTVFHTVADRMASQGKLTA